MKEVTPVSSTTLPEVGSVIKAKIGSKTFTLLVLKISTIHERTYIEGRELTKVSTAEAQKMSDLGVRLHHSGNELYVKGNGRTIKPEQVL